MRRIVLASASPRRRELLERLGCDLDVRPADVDESPLAGEDPRAYVLRVAVAKCLAVPAAPDALVVAADTTVELPAADGRAGEIAGKPADADDARRMLRALSGRTHRVHTAVVVRRGHDLRSEVVTTSVRMAAISDQTIDAYLASGEPYDKAGAYAIQGAAGGYAIQGAAGGYAIQGAAGAYAIQGVAGAFVERVCGSVTNVVGLPVAHLLRLVAELDG